MIAALVSENQATFRALMDCMARPGEIKTFGCVDAPPPLMAGTAAIVRSLADYETPVWLDAPLAEPAVAEWIRFQTGASVVVILIVITIIAVEMISNYIRRIIL